MPDRQIALRKSELMESDQEACFSECIWYEAGEEHETCLNRHDFICQKYRAEVFGRHEGEHYH